jgi:hypothetical protein
MPTKPHIWTAFHLGAAVRLVGGIPCPYCRRELRAQDVELLEDGDARIVRMVCPGCHRDMWKIERP